MLGTIGHFLRHKTIFRNTRSKAQEEQDTTITKIMRYPSFSMIRYYGYRLYVGILKAPEHIICITLFIYIRINILKLEFRINEFCSQDEFKYKYNNLNIYVKSSIYSRSIFVYNYTCLPDYMINNQSIYRF